jgi:hypothetical protein
MQSNLEQKFVDVDVRLSNGFLASRQALDVSEARLVQLKKMATIIPFRRTTGERHHG